MYVTFQTMADSNQEEENEEHFAIHRNELVFKSKNCCVEKIVLMIFSSYYCQKSDDVTEN